MSDLEKQVAIVTGGGTGIGRAVALALAGAGVKVVVCGRRLKPLEQTLQEIDRLGDERLDVSQEADVRTSSPSTTKAIGFLFNVNHQVETTLSGPSPVQ